MKRYLPSLSSSGYLSLGIMIGRDYLSLKYSLVRHRSFLRSSVRTVCSS